MSSLPQFIKTACMCLLLSGCASKYGSQAVLLSQKGVQSYCRNTPPGVRETTRAAINTCDGAVYSLCPGDNADALANDILAHRGNCS